MLWMQQPVKILSLWLWACKKADSYVRLLHSLSSSLHLVIVFIDDLDSISKTISKENLVDST